MERTHYCGTLRRTHIGLQATVCGWVLTCRDMGGVIFIDLRDRAGKTQVVVVTHSARLRERLAACDASEVELVKQWGETQIDGQTMLTAPPWDWGKR